ncbi:MAG: hypothetical protein ACKO40_13030 [Planctomycetaceae bacterium]
MDVESQPWLVCVAAAIATGAAAVTGGFLARGSTAVPAAVWALIAAASFGMEAVWRTCGGLQDQATADGWRLVVAALSLCPIMSVLGGKRPQHGVWQFIVATLAGVIALPAASAALVRPGSPPDVHPLQRWLMLMVVLVAGMNYAATSRAAAVGLVVVGQAMLLRRWLPFGDASSPSPWFDAAAACLVAGGATLAAVQSFVVPVRRRPAAVADRHEGGDPAADLSAAFMALRETLGVAWSLRISERFNAVAMERGWPCRLGHDGMHVDPATADAAWRDDAVRTGRALLRRFVTPGWMRRHVARTGERPPN